MKDLHFLSLSTCVTDKPTSLTVANPLILSQICQRPCFKNSLQIYKQFFNFTNIFQYFFSHEKRNRTFITTIITTARRFTIKLPHVVILLTSMTSMQQRGLEPLHPCLHDRSSPYWAYWCSITSGGYQPQNIQRILYSAPKCFRPLALLGQLLGS